MRQEAAWPAPLVELGCAGDLVPAPGQAGDIDGVVGLRLEVKVWIAAWPPPATGRRGASRYRRACGRRRRRPGLPPGWTILKDSARFCSRRCRGHRGCRGLYWLSATPRSAAFPEPLRGTLVVGALAACISVEHGEIGHRLGVAALGGLRNSAGRYRRLSSRSYPSRRGPEPEDRGHHAALRGCGHAISRPRRDWSRRLCLQQAHADFIGRGRVAFQRCRPQHRSPCRCRQAAVRPAVPHHQ